MYLNYKSADQKLFEDRPSIWTVKISGRRYDMHCQPVVWEETSALIRTTILCIDDDCR
ncbi:hypothetical protein EG68_12645 [Paragonimus skrjabini miyazakii]|uniref:Uncharacterized protein n=1 Tax=Paragonimus skrjabini miyazakii TaxID=59628 RepID=A0A8S9YC12_9TREM|nr:hypothetical protein EG68_12645 [Paragonimus skrjabini miyazakii]